MVIDKEARVDRQQPAQAQVLVGIDIGKHAHHAAAVAADGMVGAAGGQ